MKKYILSTMLLCAAVLGFTSCEDDSTEDTSKITYFVDLERLGDAVVFVEKGTAYVEPGYTAVEGGEDVSDNVVVDGSVDTSTPGYYSLSYSCANADGFAKAFTRTVYVYDQTGCALELGTYVVDTSKAFRIYKGTQRDYSGAFEVTIVPLGNNEYYTEDFFGGWYWQGAGYGDRYAAKGKFALDASNNMSLVESAVAGWGDEVEDLTAGSYDPATETLSYVAWYVGGKMEFHAVLTKK